MQTFITLNSIVNGSTNWLFELIINFIFREVLPNLWILISAPFTNPQMMWIVTPLLISMTLMQLYFARHRNEELGWNTAFGNSISLIFVSINLLQYLFNQFSWSVFNIFNPITNKVYLVMIMGLLSFIQLLINYYHLIPKKIAFFINSSIPTNLTAYISIIIIYTAIPFKLGTLTAGLVLLSVLIFFFNKLKKLIPMSKEAEDYIIKQEERAERRRLWQEKMDARQERASDAKMIDAIIAISIIVLMFASLIAVKSFIILPIFINPLIQGLLGIIITFIIIKKRGLSIKNLNYDGDFKEFITGVILGLPLFLIVIGLVYLAWFFVPSSDLSRLLLSGLEHANTNLLINIITFVIIMPLGSELVFRGLIQRSIKSTTNQHTAVFSQALLFSLVSFSFSILDGLSTPFMALSVPIIFVSGLILGYMRD
ncbi:MAG TPA: CPBP family intramembrane glutamic endopeptidase, partial [Candidatus Nanoarchaeia archaeon]|nr:CPBP family intramembrane glutamic endopeptidase [Candidatus Nanoarchaeia archaeon]